MVCAGVQSCASAPALPDEYLGQWYFTGTSGGIDGGGTGEPAVGWIVITAGNEIETYDASGVRAGTERFELGREQSIYTGQDAWVLNGPGGLGRVIQLFPDGSMAISDNAYDGYSRGYQRTPPAGD
jgi:hypothetical protein